MVIQIDMPLDHASSGHAFRPGPGNDGAPESDGVYVRRFQAGDRGALVELVRRHELAVRRLVLGLWDDRHEAEDLCQEVFLRLIQHLPDLTPPASLQPWLYRTALNLVRDRARRRRARRWLRLAGQPGIAHTADTGQGADARAIRQEGVDRLREEIRQLRPTWREVVVLRDLLGLPPQQAAEVLSTSDKVVNDRLYRARRELAIRLGP